MKEKKNSENSLIVVGIYFLAIILVIIVGGKNFLLESRLNANLTIEQKEFLRVLINNIGARRQNNGGDDTNCETEVRKAQKNCIDKGIPVFKIWLAELI